MRMRKQGGYDLSCPPPETGHSTSCTAHFGMRSMPSHTKAIFMCGRNPNPTENHRGMQEVRLITNKTHSTNLINFYLSGFNTYIQGIIGGSIQNGCPAGSIITRQRSSYWYSDKLAPHDKAYFTPSSTS